MRRRLAPIVLTAALLLAARAAPAAPVNPADVAAGANWVVHLDVDQLLKNDLGQHLLRAWKAKTLDLTPAAALQLANFDPATDLAGATLYGTDADPAAGVAVFHGTFDEEKISALLALGPDHAAAPYGAHVVHAWKQSPEDAADDGARHGAFADAHTFVVSRTAKSVETALDTLDGKAKPAAGLVPDLSPGTYLFAAAKDFTLPKGAGGALRSKLLDKLSALLVQVGSDGPDTFLTAKADLPTPEQGRQARQILGGLLAYATLALPAAADAGIDFAPLLQATKIAGDGPAVEIDAKLETDSVLKLIDAAQRPPGAAD